ncbi:MULTISPECIES: glycosyltransferase [unclassified Pseudomonas]|uniref:glycosyltransferase n=1 Tax=unclassified Pseudomonas TaxID=196821 RepID=UPI001F384E23|nr:MULTISPECIES: glycosyltransferase [unclassified Pseudomonas]MCF5233277.1 glycosyltransferase [Pseudomonas sp. PA-5-4H]MCF5236087.1 glycosyltransferase [Pseudomonas sp. PA-5-4G]MCF5250253.1 glycosyltransferase [Pseudomonas sp. PA-5-4B]MCF5256535.1 glycosyltransferase [Pseudomonas sp. PA-5-4B]MCF5262971.1 glycosyltransferase [Pseudomonas sp. PA-5-4A]
MTLNSADLIEYNSTRAPIFMSSDEMSKVAEQLLGSCGNGPLLHIGLSDLPLIQYFLASGIQVISLGLDPARTDYCAHRLNGRFQQLEGEQFPFANDQFNTVLVTELPQPGVLETRFIEETIRVSNANVFLYLDHPEPSQASAFRKYCEAQFFQAGMRKHAAYYRVNDYQALQEEQGKVAIPLEKIPTEAALKYPLTALIEERDLHMDMTREPGSRSDAHIIRYVLASRYIRPGDRVLDAACGLGYGSYLLRKCSDAASVLGIDGSEYAIEYAKLNFAAQSTHLSFKEGWLPKALVDIPDNSIDLVTSFETLEHVQDPKALMAEFHRVLTPAGRIVLSVPRDWSDETGEDPNPFHFHVYTWEKILQETQQHFLVEAAFGQTADQYKKNKQWAVGTRQLFQTSVDTLATDDPECEWCLLVGMKAPSKGADVPYTETTYDQYPENPEWHVTRFEEYDNPWLVKGMVTIGHRISNAQLLSALSKQVALEAPATTPDQGAALCVSGYQLYASAECGWVDVELFEGQCQPYLNETASTPQQLRWQVSLCYLLAQLWQKYGESEKAISYYVACTAFNCADYSPTLITKQIHAFLNLGLIESGRSHTQAAIDYWQQGLIAAEAALKLDWKAAYGSLENPSDFGLYELGAIVEYATSCAYALRYVENAEQKTPQWWHQLQRDRISQLCQLDKMRVEIDRLNKLLINKDILMGEVSEMAKREVNAFYSHTVEKDQKLNQSGLELQRLNLLIEAKNDLLNEIGQKLNHLDHVIVEKDLRLNEVGQEIASLSSTTSHKESKLHELGVEIHRLNLLLTEKDAYLNELGSEIALFSEQSELKSTQLGELGNEVHRLQLMITEKDSRLNELGNEIVSFSEQYELKSTQLGELGTEVHRLQLMITEKDSRLNELGNEIVSFSEQSELKSTQLGELGAEVHRLQLMMTEKDSRLSELGDALSHLNEQYEQKDNHVGELALELNRLNEVIVEKDLLLNETGREISRLNAHCEDKEQQLSEQGLEVEQLNLMLLEKDSLLANTHQEIFEANLQIRQNDSQLDELSTEVNRLNAAINEKDNVINSLKEQLERSAVQLSEEQKNWSHAIEQEKSRFNQLRQTRLLRWRDAIAARPVSLRGIAKIIYLSGSLVMPSALRNRLRVALLPAIQRLRNQQAGTAISTTPETGYLVKQPKKLATARPIVVHVIANFMTGGSSRLVVDIYEYLGGKYDQRIVTSYAPQPAAYVGIPVEEVRFPDDEAPFVNLFEDIQPDFIHMHYWGDCDEPWYAKAVKAAEVMGIPVIQNINTPVAPYYSEAIKRYVYVSDYVRRVFGKEQSNHVTVYPGSDFAMFQSRNSRKPKEDCIGMVYRLEGDKLNSESIMPFILATQKKPSIKVLIVGGGSLMEPFMKATEEAGVAENFEFTGYVPYDTLPAIYDRMKIFVAPVWKESFGQVSPFAMNMRVPVVGFDIGAIGEIVEDDSLLAPPGNSDALSDIIVSLLEDDARRLKIAELHRKRAQNNFSIQAMIKGYQNIYSDIMVEKKK